MKLLVTALAAQPAGRGPSSAPHSHSTHDDQGADHSHGDGHGHGDGHSHGDSGGIEWEDDMVAVNRLTTPANMRWKLVDRATGAANGAIDWQFTEGDRVKIRLVNEMDSDHPMHHPFHLHGAGRFLVLARDGVAEPNLVWKDTVLVRTGQTLDILFDVTNPGLWMVVQWLRQVHPTTTWTTSVCTGSIYLAAAGILDGQEATTHWAWAEQLERHGAHYTEQRVVEHGKVITAAGVSSGIDMALTLLARMYGPQLAEGVQLAIEYDPHPPFDTGSPSKAPAEIVEFVRSQLNTLAAAEQATTG